MQSSWIHCPHADSTHSIPSLEYNAKQNAHSATSPELLAVEDDAGLDEGEADNVAVEVDGAEVVTEVEHGVDMDDTVETEF